MLDIKWIRDNPDAVKKAAKQKHFPDNVDQILELDNQIRQKQVELEELQSTRNRLSKEIPKADADKREAIKQEVASIKPRLDELDKWIKGEKDKLQALMLLVPAPARHDVPEGKDDSENVEVKTWGDIPEFSFKPLDHVTIGEKRGLIDFPRGVKLAGSRSYVLRGVASQLENAILRFTFDTLIQRGFEPFSIPVLVKEEAMIGTGYFPTGKDQAYYVEKDKLALVGTAEVPLASFHSDEMLKEDELPKRFMAQSSCFRREAGTYGKDTKGLYRVHQFQKIEQVVICKNDENESEKIHQELLENSEFIMQQLELPYRVVYVCTGDLGQGQVRKHDIEAWMPSRNAYSETHSCSTFHEFQARRLNIRYKDSNKKKFVCHTLNNTAIATPRALIPFIEVHQQQDMSIKIPLALRPYLNDRESI